MADAGTTVYIYPTWGLTPLPKHKFHAVHATVTFAEDSAAAPDIVHNLDLPWAAAPAMQPPDLVWPIVIVNPISAGPAAPSHVLTVKDGNTISIQRSANGPGMAVTYDVWIFRPNLKTGWFE